VIDDLGELERRDNALVDDINALRWASLDRAKPIDAGAGRNELFPRRNPDPKAADSISEERMISDNAVGAIVKRWRVVQLLAALFP
jgi:hypothetical protein